jgi:APA family basic amino acid/polyamine antiporter
MLMAWVVTALLTLIAALSYGELAAMMPEARGQYIYLREAFGPLAGFLYGWTFFTVIQALAPSPPWPSPSPKFLGVFAPELSQKGVAIALIIFSTWLNTRGLRTGRARPKHLQPLAEGLARCSA